MEKTPDLEPPHPPDTAADASEQTPAGRSARREPEVTSARSASQALGGPADVTGPAEESQAAPSEPADRVTELADAVDRQELRIQEIETSLVTRIADVDDDRRITTNRLQRAWQTQRDEIEARLRRQASIAAGALLLLVALLLGAFLLAYSHLDSARRSLSDDLAQLRLQYQELKPLGPENARLQEQLSSLGASVEALSRETPEGEQPPGQGPDLKPDAAAEGIAMPAEPVRPVPDQALDGAAQREDGDEPSPPRAPDRIPATEQPPLPSETPPGVAAAEAGPDGTSPPARDAGRAADPERIPSASDRTVLVGDRRYALQLIGSHSRDAMLDFARREPLPSEVYYREESYQGRPWFVLIHSLHARRDDAVAAISKLPSELATLDLWIRDLPPETELGVLSRGR